MRIAGEAIELGDDQCRFSNLAFREGSRELRAIVPLAALDLDELRAMACAISRSRSCWRV